MVHGMAPAPPPAPPRQSMLAWQDFDELQVGVAVEAHGTHVLRPPCTHHLGYPATAIATATTSALGDACEGATAHHAAATAHHAAATATATAHHAAATAAPDHQPVQIP